MASAWLFLLGVATLVWVVGAKGLLGTLLQNHVLLEQGEAAGASWILPPHALGASLQATT